MFTRGSGHTFFPERQTFPPSAGVSVSCGLGRSTGAEVLGQQWVEAGGDGGETVVKRRHSVKAGGGR